MIDKKAFNKQLLALAFPLALQNLLSSLVGASDALMLGRLSQDAISAVSLANQISFVMSLFIGTVTGAAGVLAAQYWGKGDFSSARRFTAMAIRYAIAVSIAFFCLAFFFPQHLMGIFTTDIKLIKIGAEYLKIVGFSYLFQAVAQCFLMLMKVSGFAKMSVIISAVTVAVDMSADFFLIYGFGKIPALGANGSAYSTVAMEAVSLVWCIIWALRHGSVRISAKELTAFSSKYEKDIWQIIPGMLASSMSWGLSMTMHSFILGHMGSDATAAASVATVVQQMTQCITMGVSGATGIIIGGLLGQGKLDTAKEYGARFFKVSLVCGLINVALIALVSPFCYIFYVLESAAKQYLIGMLIFSGFYMFAYAYNTVITCGVFPAGGDSKYDAVSVFFTTWCFAVPLALIACFILKLPPLAVFIIMCLDEIAKVPFIPLRYKKYIWVKDLTQTEIS